MFIIAAAALAAWTFKVDRDSMTDTEIAVAVAPDQNQTVAFSLRCEGRGSRELFINATSMEYLGGRGGSSQARDIGYRVDQGTPSAMTGIYRSNRVMVAPSPDVDLFAEKAATARQRILIRLETYDGRHIDGELSAVGAAQSVGKIVEFCSKR